MIKIKRHIIPILTFAFCLGLVMQPQQAEAQIWDKISKRLFKKNKIRKVGKRLYNKEAPPLESFEINDQYEVIGFEPSWLIQKEEFDENYYFNLLSTLVVGEYDVDPTTGYPRNRGSFPAHYESKVKTKGEQYNIIEFARKQNKLLNILLHVTYSGDYGPDRQKEYYFVNFLQDAQGGIHEKLTDSLRSHLDFLSTTYGIPQKELGVVLDFDFLRRKAGYFEGFSKIIEKTREDLGDDYKIYVKIDPQIPGESFLASNTIDNISEMVDRFIVKGYGYENYYARRRIMTPVTIMARDSFPTVDSTLNYYLKNGIDQEKLILEFPYYGVAWKQIEDGPPVLRRFDRYKSIHEINERKGVRGTQLYSKDSLTTFFTLTDPLGVDTVPDYYYYDDGFTFYKKFEYVKSRDTIPEETGIKGISLYGIGYNGTSKKFNNANWYAIAYNYGRQRSRLGWVIAGFLVAGLPLGFVYSVLRYWQVRNVIAKYRKYRTRFVLAFFIFTFIFLTVAGILPRSTVGLIIGAIIVGIFALYILIRRRLSKMRRYSRYVK